MIKQEPKPTPDQLARQKLCDQIVFRRPSATQIRKIIKRVEGRPISVEMLLTRHFYNVIMTMDQNKLERVLKVTKDVCDK